MTESEGKRSALEGPEPPPSRPLGPPLPGPRVEPESGLLERYRAVGLAILLMGLAAALVVGLAYGHYQLAQAPHRLLKVLLGLGLAVALFIRPAIALYAVPFAFAFVEWLPKSPLPGLNSLNLITVVLVVTWISRVVFQKTVLFERTALNRPFGFFFAWVVLAWTFGAMQGTVVGSALASFQLHLNIYIGLFLFFPLLYLVRTWEQIRRLSVWFVVASGAGVFTLLRESTSMGGDRRVGGAIGDINMAGAFYALVTVFGLVLISVKWIGPWRRVLTAGATAAACFAMFLTGSRGALVALAVGAIPQTLRTGMKGILIATVLVGTVSIAAPSFVGDRLQETWNGLVGGSSAYDAADDVSGGRLELWRTILGIVAQNPILGIGLGRLPLVLSEEYGRIKAGHNMYLEALAEMGIPGLALLLWLLAASVRSGWKLSKHPGFAGALGSAYLFAMLSLIVSNVFGQRLFHFTMDGTWAFLGALVCRATQLVESGHLAEDLDAPAQARTTRARSRPFRRPGIEAATAAPSGGGWAGVGGG